MTDRITIKVQSRDEGREIITKIADLTALHANTGTEISFVLQHHADLMDVANLLEVPSSIGPIVTVTHTAPVTPDTKLSQLHRTESVPLEFGGPRHNAPVVTCTPDPLACNLATQIAWLEGFSIASECTGTFHCEIVDHKNAHSRIKYDPVGRSAIWAELLAKYRVDCSWDVQGVDCEFKIYGTNKEGSYCILADSQLSDFGYCIGSAIVQVILSAERKRK